MITTYSKHGRTSQDGARLTAHLLKPENVSIEILGIGNSVAADLAGVVKDMELLRNGSSARAAFHHLSINPSIDYSKEQLLAAAHALRFEFDPDDTRPWIVLAHSKARQNSDKGHQHAHLVLGHVDGDGRALKDGRAKIRCEVVARTVEYQNGEAAVVSPHHATVVKFLRERGREEVANWLVTACGENPEKPKSAYGTKALEAAKRRGIDLPEAKGAISAAWVAANEIDAFRDRLARLGYQIQPGKKENVWIVTDAHGNIIGALDRLLKLQRHAAKNLMEKLDGPKTGQPRPPSIDRRAREEAVREIDLDCRTGGSTETSAFPVAAGGKRGSRSGSADHGASGKPDRSRHTSDHANTVARRQDRRVVRRFERQRALAVMRVVGQSITGMSVRQLAPEDYVVTLPRQWNATDIWGIALQPPRPPGP